MALVMVDSNVLLDVFTEDPVWFVLSSRTLAKCAQQNVIVINPIIYAEVSVGFEAIEQLDAALPVSIVQCRVIPLDAAFLAGKCFEMYRRSGGQKRSPLPDFFIGAHAAVQGMTLLTRDAARYKTYFPSLPLLFPS